MDKDKIIGIIGAMDEEVDELKEIMECHNTTDQAGLTFYTGLLHGEKVVVVRCGIGKVNAAICTQVLIDQYDVNVIVNVGVAGALHKTLDIGDIVISSDAVYHDFDTTAFGHKKGIIPRMDESFFKADEEMIKLAKEAGENLPSNPNIFVQRIVSGDQFVASKELKEEIIKEFDAYCTEMEGAAIAHTCYLNQIPFVIIRAISDKADHSAEINFNEFVIKAAKNSSLMIQNILQNLK